MASKRKIRRKACTGKVRHETLEQAIAAKGKSWFGKALLSYKCKFCGGYHNGHPPKKIRKAIDKAKKGL